MRMVKGSIGLLVIILLGAANLFVATYTSAHTGGNDHFIKSGDPVDFWIYNTTNSDSENTTAANNAIIEWDNDTIIRRINAGYFTYELWVYDTNVNASYVGGFYPYRTSDGHFRYGHAWFDEADNATYGGNDTGAVFCQEIGHGFGLYHSDNGCMGWGYYGTGAANRNVIQHNIDDIYNQYRFSHH